MELRLAEATTPQGVTGALALYPLHVLMPRLCPCRPHTPAPPLPTLGPAPAASAMLPPVTATPVSCSHCPCPGEAQP